MQNEYYKNTWGISQSAIKDFRFKSPRKWKEIWIDKQIDLDKDEDDFVFGSLVDTMLFTPSFIDKRFYLADSNKIPTGTVAKIVRGVYESVLKNYGEIPDSIINTEVIDSEELPEPYKKVTYDMSGLHKTIIEEINKEDWNSNWKEDTKVKKIIEKGSEYFGLLCESNGRKVISSDMNLQALSLVNTLQKSESVSKYFTDSENTRNIFQLEIFEKHEDKYGKNIPIKCAIDILHIDEKYKTIQVCDFKTTHSSFNFIESIKRYGYCDQLSFYTYILRKSIKNPIFANQIGINIDDKWTILEPINIVIDNTEQVPYIYEYDWKDIQISQYGNKDYLYNLYMTVNHASRVKKGWVEILDEISWHINNNKWDYPYEIYIAGKIKVNLLNS